jgi:hypothetical protein
MVNFIFSETKRTNNFRLTHATFKLFNQFNCNAKEELSIPLKKVLFFPRELLHRGQRCR